MPRGGVEVIGRSSASPEAVWAIARDFAGAWHPLIATIREARDGRGALIRAFTAKGEDTLYREQLTYFSDSDRTLRYRHLEGIAGAEAYEGGMVVEPDGDGGSTIRWTASVTAAKPRLSSISAGTKAIFEMGVEALDRLARERGAGAQASIEVPADFPTETVFVEGDPRLALTASASDAGNGGGATISLDTSTTLCLFLHGIGGSRRNWLPQVRAAGTLMRSASLDLRGYGESALGAAQSTVEDYCADILRVRDAFGADRLVLVGLSYGSWIATSFAMRHPEVLAGLVLSGGCTGMSEAGIEEREAFRRSRQVPLDAGQTPADFAPNVVQVLAGPNASDAVRAELLASMAAIPSVTYRDALTCFTSPPERFDFSRLTMPVLMMTGQYDRLASPAEIRGVAGRIHAAVPLADVRYETIADAGHVCNVEEPERYNRLLLEFLGRLPR